MVFRRLIAALLFTIPVYAGSIFKEPPVFKPQAVVFLPNDTYFDVLREKINSAQKEIVISMFLFKTTGPPVYRPNILVEELGKAVRRGVDVKVILEMGPKEKRSRVDEDNLRTAVKLIEKNIKVYFDPPNVDSHAKIVVIDRKYVFIGSHNFTQSGLLYNNEASVMIVSPKLAEEVLKYIEEKVIR